MLSFEDVKIGVPYSTPEHDRPIFIFINRKKGKLYHFILRKYGQEDFPTQFDLVNEAGWNRMGPEWTPYYVFQNLIEVESIPSYYEKTIKGIFELYDELD